MAERKKRKITTKRTVSRGASNKLSQAQFMAVEYHLQGHTMQAAMAKAGYSATTAESQGARFFAQPRIAEYLAYRRAEMVRRADSIQDRIKDELAKIAFFNIGNFTAIDEKTGDFIYDFREASMDDLAAIGEVTVETYTEGRGPMAEEVKRVRVKPYAKDAALQALARIHGMFTDNVNINDGGMTIEERLHRGRKRLNAPDVVDGEFKDVTPSK